ncbi:MAG: heavy-metal-associated domain-containing protein [Flavobacteriaceae bacterium]|nr:heavy-metal-associated domain-containing protein [Flavobacteriaceae bacterium]
MKIIKNLFFTIMLTAFVISCNGENNEKTAKQDVPAKEISENIKSVEVQIEGMTCEIGCARLIQSKLYKTDGVKFAKVSFEENSGKITYNANKISISDLKEVVQKTGGGDLYKVVSIIEVEGFADVN